MSELDSKFFSLCKEPLCIFDCKAIILQCNAAAQAIFGGPAESLQGQCLNDFLHPDHRRKTMDTFANAASLGTAVLENRIVHRNGSSRWLNWSLSYDSDTQMVYALAWDVTAAKEEIEHLRDREMEDALRTLEIVTSSISDIIWMRDVETNNLIYLSRAFERIMERPIPDLKKTPLDLISMIHPEDQHMAQALIKEVPEQENVAIYRVITPSGKVKWIRDRISPLRNSDNRIERIVGIASDITKEREQELELSETSRQQQQILDAIADMVLVKGPNSKIKWANKAFLEYYGMSNDELAGVIDAPYVEPDYTLGYVRDDQYVFSTGKVLDIPNEPVKRHDGQVRHFHTVKSPIFNSNGEVVMTVGVSRDMTDRLRQEETLRSLYTLIESSSEIFGYCDPEGKPIYINKSARELLGWHTNAASIKEFLPEHVANNSFDEALAIASSGKTWEGENIFTNVSTGESIPVWQRVFAVFDEEGKVKYFATIATDIRARKSAELALLQSSKLASLGEMAGGIAHEINNPLAVIRGKANVLQKLLQHPGWDVQKIVECANSIVQTSDRIAQIVRGMRAFSRDDASEPTRLELISDILKETLSLCRERIRNHGIELRVGAIAPDLAIECRATQIGQVLINLLNNAHDAVLTLSEKWIEVVTEESEHEICIKVIDSGRGVPPEVRDKLMQPFFTTKPAGSGTGLGLSISRRIVETHKGRLEYLPHSAHTTFVVHLPRRTHHGTR